MHTKYDTAVLNVHRKQSCDDIETIRFSFVFLQNTHEQILIRV